MSRIRYEHVHPNKLNTSSAKTISDFIKIHEEYLEKLKRWEAQGIQLDPYGVGNGYAIFYTYDENIALEEGFERIRTESGNTLPRR